MIARRWRVWTKPELADALVAYLEQTGLRDALRTDGNAGGLLVRGPQTDGRVEFTLLTFWDSMAAVERFAGGKPDQAVLYPEDAEWFAGYDELVEHLDVVAAPRLGLLSGRSEPDSNPSS